MNYQFECLSQINSFRFFIWIIQLLFFQHFVPWFECKFFLPNFFSICFLNQRRMQTQVLWGVFQESPTTLHPLSIITSAFMRDSHYFEEFSLLFSPWTTWEFLWMFSIRYPRYSQLLPKISLIPLNRSCCMSENDNISQFRCDFSNLFLCYSSFCATLGSVYDLFHVKNEIFTWLQCNLFGMKKQWIYSKSE